MAKRGSEGWRNDEWGAPCSTDKTTIDWISADPSYGQKQVRLTVDRRAVPIFRAMAAVIVRHRYVVHADQTGASNCRHIDNDPNRPWSSHAWATAVDVNWRQNPDGSRLVTDMPQAMIDEIVGLLCADGQPCFRWGGDWDRDPRTGHSYYDAMHFEAWCTPAEIASGPIHDLGDHTMPKLCDAMILVPGTTGTPDVINGLAGLFDAPTGVVLTADVDVARRAHAAGVRVYAIGKAADAIDGDTDLRGVHRLDTAQKVLAQAKSGW